MTEISLGGLKPTNFVPTYMQNIYTDLLKIEIPQLLHALMIFLIFLFCQFPIGMKWKKSVLCTMQSMKKQQFLLNWLNLMNMNLMNMAYKIQTLSELRTKYRRNKT